MEGWGEGAEEVGEGGRACGLGVGDGGSGGHLHELVMKGFLVR